MSMAARGFGGVELARGESERVAARRAQPVRTARRRRQPRRTPPPPRRHALEPHHRDEIPACRRHRSSSALAGGSATPRRATAPSTCPPRPPCRARTRTDQRLGRRERRHIRPPRCSSSARRVPSRGRGTARGARRRRRRRSRRRQSRRRRSRGVGVRGRRGADHRQGMTRRKRTGARARDGRRDAKGGGHPVRLSLFNFSVVWISASVSTTSRLFIRSGAVAARPQCGRAG